MLWVALVLPSLLVGGEQGHPRRRGEANGSSLSCGYFSLDEGT